jgi:hypothetical protein
MPIGISLVTQNDTSLSGVSSASSQAAISVTLGDFIFTMLSWWQNTGTQSGTVSSFTDSGGNTWTQVGSTLYSSTDTHAGQIALAMYYAVAKATQSISWSFSLSGVTAGTLNIRFNVWDFGPNIFSPYLDTTSTQANGSTTSFSTNNFTPNYAADALFLVAVNNEGATLASVNTAFTVPTEGTGSNGNILQYIPFLGEGTSTLSAPYSWTGTLSAAADWLSIQVGFETTSLEFLAQGDTFEASQGYFLSYQELYFQGFIFAGLYTGIPWLKNVYMMSRDYWDTSLSTPYSGQLFPVGPGEGGPGQIYPY